MSVSLKRKLELYKEFKRVVKLHEPILGRDYNIRVDKAYRLYTVINITDEELGEYGRIKSDVDTIADGVIRNEYQRISRFLNNINLIDLYKVYEVKRVDTNSFLMVIGYKLFNTNKFRLTMLASKVLGIGVILASTLYFIL